MSCSNYEILKYLTDSGMIDIDEINANINMRKREKILSNHPYNVWQASDGFWKTYLPDERKGRKLVKKRERESVEDEIVSFYDTKISCQLKKRFGMWVERQEILGRSSNTIHKYKTEYRRFFKGYSIEKKDLWNIDEISLSKHLKNVIIEKEIPYLSVKQMYGMLCGVYEVAVKERLVDENENPMKYIDIKMFKRYCKEKKIKTTEERILTPIEQEETLASIKLFKILYPDTVSNYAVELAMYTGMRVGELAGLMWEDIDFDRRIIIIRHSERYDKENEDRYSIGDTKNHLWRFYPMTDDIFRIITDVYAIEKKNGWLSEFVFSNEKGRVHANAISSRALRMTNGKSIHAIRRTVNSILKCNGVSSTIASSLIGNTERCNDMYYTYDVSDYEEKFSYVNNFLRYGKS